MVGTGMGGKGQARRRATVGDDLRDIEDVNAETARERTRNASADEKFLQALNAAGHRPPPPPPAPDLHTPRRVIRAPSNGYARASSMADLG
jgi:hypothetical protein